MKHLLTYSVLAVGLLVPVIGQSQTPDRDRETIRYGIVGGASLNDIESGFEDYDEASSDMVGFTAGIQGAWQFADVLSLKPELLFARRGWDTEGTAFDQTFNANYNFSYLELPLLLSASTDVARGVRPKLMAGPHASLFLDGSQDGAADPFTGGADEIDGDLINDLQFGVTGAVGADIDVGDLTLTTDVRYQRNFTGVFDTPAPNGVDDSVEHEAWQLTLGFLF